MTFTGLIPGRDYRVTAWMKVGSLSRMLLDVRDGAKMHAGTVFFNLSPPAITGASGGLVGAKAERGPDQWVKTSVDLRSTDGIVVAYVGQVFQDGSSKFLGASNIHLMLGGIEVDPIL
jgi:hypothetical protein